MSMVSTARWSPRTETDRQSVLREMEAILSSHHFRNSKRYPALLGYLVEKTLAGQADQLKERTLGIEVFGRSPDYDTNADPIVRVTAAEVRKRIAQFYHETGHASCLQVDLPLGSYAPEFKRFPVTQKSPFEDKQSAGPTRAETTNASKSSSWSISAWHAKLHLGSFRWLLKPFSIGLLLLAASIACITVYALDKRSAHRASDQFWEPIMNSSGPVLTVLPTSIHTPIRQGADDTTVKLTHGPYNHISVCDAVALSLFASFFGEHSKSFDMKEADLTSLGDLHGRSAILVGALNNHWTMRLIEPLRLHFSEEPALVRIVDSQNPQNRDWFVDYAKPYAYATHDYAIIARYADPTTGGNVLIAAGIGAHATQAASEFLTSSKALEQINAIAPTGWKSKNLELVIKTDIINGDAGPPHVVAAITW
jgi:hypothetical protein